MARQKDNTIRDQIISNLLSDLDSELNTSSNDETPSFEVAQDPTKFESLVDPTEEEKDSQELKSENITSNDNQSPIVSGAGTQVATEILTPSFNLPIFGAPKNEQKTEVVAQPSEETHYPNEKKDSDYEAPLSHFSTPIGDSKLQTAHYLKLAQDKIRDLEREIDRLREENDLLVIAAQTAKKQAEDFAERLTRYERERVESLEQAQMEINIYRENLAAKEKERKLLQEQVRQLEGSVSKEIKKIRNRERELENRLELSKQERMAVLRAKDDIILDLRRRIDDLNQEIENHRNQYAQLKQKAHAQHGQLSRTVRALRLALAHLESEGEDQIVPLKKAE
jgi:DNA repair exonuclease SbcCD ATPase subunit